MPASAVGRCGADTMSAILIDGVGVGVDATFEAVGLAGLAKDLGLRKLPRALRLGECPEMVGDELDDEANMASSHTVFDPRAFPEKCLVS